jgi:hypothetical protein
MEYAAKVALVGAGGMHIRFVPGALAAGMVAIGSARPTPAGGKVREVTLEHSAESYALRIGPADGRMRGVRFYRSVRIDSTATRVYEHHPRCLW